MAGIGKDISFGVDHFQRPKLSNENEAIAQSIINLLLAKKGQLPSMPHIGIDLPKFLYDFEDEVDIDYIKSQIEQQCPALSPKIDAENAQISVNRENDGTSSLLLVIPIINETNILIGVKKKDDTLLFDYKFDENIFN